MGVLASTMLGHGTQAAESAGWAAYLGSVAVLLAFVLGAPTLGAWVLRPWRLGGDDSEDGGNEDGGGGPGRGPTPPDADPPWWPEFERDFAAYVDAQLARV
jgi:hypothetical protein